MAVAALVALVGLLLWIAVVDARTRTIPNVAVLTVAILGGLLLVGRCFDPVLFSFTVTPREGLSAAAAILGAGLAFELAWRAFHGGRHGMGMGDVKLASAVALWLGWDALPMVALACLAAAAVNAALGSRSFAFGPYLVGAFALGYALRVLCGS